MPAPTRQAHSLRTHLYWGLGCIGLGVMLATVGLRSFVGGRIKEQADAQVRSLSRHQHLQALLLILMDEEIGLRSYLGTGNYSFLASYYKGGRIEQGAVQDTLDDLQPGDRRAAQARIDQMLARIKEWHGNVAGPSIRIREKGPLPNPKTTLVLEKEWFDSITEAIAFLGRSLDAQDEKRLLDLHHALSLARWIEWVTSGGLLVLGFLLAHWILRKVAEPLSDLAERVRTRAGFPDPWDRRTIKEVDILGQALYELNLQNRKREQVLKAAYEEDHATKAYAEMVQHVSREEDLLAALDQALARQLQTTRQRVLLRPAVGEGLVAFFPPMSAGEAAGHPIMAQADLCRAIRQGAPVHLGSADPIACLCSLGVPREGAYLCIPLVASGRTMGLVNLQADNAEHWTTGRRRIAANLVATTAAALQAIRALHQAQERSLRDGLTGVHNRGFLDEFLPKIADQAKRKGSPFSLLMLDIDHFKAFNDAFGHEAGDHVLRAFAQCLQAHVRGGDVVARYGGEEFAVCLPDSGSVLATALAERLREAVSAIPLPSPPFPPDRRITVSIGVASYPDHSPALTSLVPLADQALYEAKDRGRNCVFNAGDLIPGRVATE